ncbi:MAG TPA: hypothetical protein VH251_04915 [Verrucomicrobiae bacterium]|nr:hypothetical protein [Verrucomicrobiae bacterium]
MNDTNPCNSPATSTGNTDGLTDFRSRAVAASEMMRLNLPGGLSPERGGISCCLARQPSLSRFRTPIKVTVVACAILGISGIAAGGIIAHLQKAGKLGDTPSMFAIAVCCSVGGILFMFLPVFVERWIVRKHLSQREEGYGIQIERIHIALEYAPTYGSLKILAEDVGLIYIHPEAHYVKISGISYDYLIHSKDVVGLSLHSKGKTVLLSYVVGDERLDLAILPRSVVAEFKRQTLGSSRSLFLKIQNALKVQE